MRITMRIAIGSLWLLLAKPCLSQAYDTTTYYGKMGYIFSNVDRSQITTGLLRDFGIDFLDLDNFSGTSTNDSNFTSLVEWRCLYASMYSDQINGNASMLALDTLNKLLNNYASPGGPINLATLFYTYQSLDPNAITNHLLTVQNGIQLYDVSGRTQSPYDSETLFAIAPVRQSASVGANQIVFSSNLMFGNTGKTLSSIQVDPMGTGYYQSASLDVPINISYDSAGYYTINIIFHYTDGTTEVAHTKVIVYPSIISDLTYGTNHIPLSYRGTGPPFVKGISDVLHPTYSGIGVTVIPIVGSKSFMGLADTAFAIVNFAANNHSGKIQKPLIVAEGFDMAEDYPTFGIENNARFLNLLRVDENINQDISLNDGFDDGAANFNGSPVTAENYDLIYVHWASTTDYIERNAYALESVIQYVNANKIAYSPTGQMQQNVIIGQSMGGLIARYALRDMEINGQSHDTRLFISDDAPNWGANVPVGAQALVQHLAPYQIFNLSFSPFSIGWKDLFPMVQQGANLLNSPAAQEMLIQNYTFTPPTFGSTATLTANNTVHTSFMSTLNSMGWPINCKNMTLSNGVCTGATKFADNAKILNFSTSANGRSLTYFGSVFQSLVATVISPFNSVGLVNGYSGSPQLNPWAQLWQLPLSLFSTKTSVELNFWFSAVPATGTAQIYNGQMYAHRVILGLFTVNSYFINAQANSSTDMLPLDNTAGSSAPLNQLGLTPQQLTAGIPGYFSKYIDNTILLQPNLCFIPTVSSAAISNPQNYLRTNFCSQIACLDPAEVQAYYTAPADQIHISFTQDNANWLMQVQDPNYSCAKICPGNSPITGPNPLCSASSYSISNLPTSATVAWSISPAVATISSPNAQSTTVTPTGNLAAVLTANVSNVCASSTPIAITDNIAVGSPPPTDISGIYAGEDFPPNSVGEFYSNTGTVWTIYGGTIFAGQGTHDVGVRVANVNNGYLTVQVAETNACGTSAPLSVEGIIKAGGPPPPAPLVNGKYKALVTTASTASEKVETSDIQKPKECGAVSVSPNPTTGVINISAPIVDYSKAYIKVFNMQGQLLTVVTPTANITSINVAQWPSGTYAVEIFDGKNIVAKKFIKQ